MEAQIFTLDSKRFLLHRSAHPHGSDRHDPEHHYLLCDIEDNYSMRAVTEETGVTAPSIAPDGRDFYYFVDETDLDSGRLTLRRRRMDGSQPETIVVLDAPVPGTKFRPSQIYPLSSISSDGERVAISAFFGDGKVSGTWGLLVFDVPTATVNLIFHGPSWCNIHPQYSRSLDPVESHDILVQENHGNECNLEGQYTRLIGGAGADIHVIRDDGRNLRDLPWGRTADEGCQGHQCWRGRSNWAITATGRFDVKECQLIESQAVPTFDHAGLNTPNGKRNDLSRTFTRPDFYHFATDIDGRWFITDCGPGNIEGSIYSARLGEPGVEPLQDFTYLLSPRSSWVKGAHVHPFLSPDGSHAFFNSDESGILQAYMIRGLL
jgi:hypothetical protein